MTRRLGLFLLLCAAAAAQTAKRTPPPPEQPIAYSHKLHAGTLKLECKTCHPSPDPGHAMTLPAASTCMMCHTAIKTDSAAIQKLAAFAKDNLPVPWVRVYRIPAFVDFSHRAHLAKGGTCEQCHGQVIEREQLFRETDMSMGGCMDCHRAKKASIDCAYCHEQR